MSRTHWIACLALMAALSASAIDVASPKGSFTLKDRARGSQAGFCAEDLAAALKGSLGRDEISKYPVLTLEGHRILLSTASPLASVDGKIVKLPRPAAETGGCLWLPVEFLSAVLPAVLGGPVTARGAAVTPGPSESKPEVKSAPSGREDDVSVDVAVAADVVRITLQGKRATAAEVVQAAREAVVTLSEGGLVGAPRSVGKGIVEGVEFQQGGRRLKVTLGAGFRRLESAKLRNPDRLVLLFKGEGQRVEPVAPEPSAAAPGPSSATEPSLTPGPASSTPPVKTAAFDVVVLDPGHGGLDNGASSSTGLLEKNLTLDLAQRTAVLLQKEGLKVVLTRSTDTQVPLIQRTAIANYNRADLFLSIHLNASPAPSARGTETYYLSREATDLWSTELAAKENAAGQEAGATGDGGLNLVLWELAQTSAIVESAALAEAIQQEFNALLGTENRGVRQAPFVVLEGAQMPAVLVEVAFLSNSNEAKRLSDPAFQDQVASALAKSVMSFKARYERPQTPPPAP